MALAHARRWLCGGLALGLVAVPAASTGQPTVVFDGSLGAAGAAPTAALPGGGVDYRIADTRGVVVDAALFHSFSELGVNAGDAASFTGPGTIDQVFARVTGGSASQIDGLLRSEIPRADLWLLNPHGVLFGAGARLDVDGSFHASTADELRFAPGQVFEARAGGSVPTLVVAEPTAFGFLRDDPAPIEVEGELSVPEGETLSLVGGALTLDGARLQAPGGRVDLVSAGSAGTVGRAARDAPEPLDTTGLAAMAPMEITGGSRIDASGDPPGAVFIRSGELVVSGEGTEVLAINQGAGPGGRLSIVATGAAEISDGAILEVGTESNGRGGDVDLTAPSLLIDRGRVASTVLPGAAGDGGTLDVRVEGTLRIQNWEPGALAGVRDGSEPRPVGLSVGTFGSGRGGRIVIDADTVILTDYGGLAAWSVGGAWLADPVDVVTGDGGTIHVTANALTLDRGGWIYTTSLDGGEGDAGDVHLELATLEVEGSLSAEELAKTPWVQPFDNASPLIIPSAINADVVWGSKGNAGSISIVADESLTVLHGAAIGANAGVLSDGGHGGTITIHAGSMTVVGIATYVIAGTEPGTAGDAGTITIHADTLAVAKRGVIWVGANGTGDAGTLYLNVGTLRNEGGAIDAGNPGGGKAGAIHVVATESVFLSNEGGERLSLTEILFGEGQLISGLTSGTEGSIRVEAPLITVTEGAIIGTSSLGPRDAGDIVLRGGRIVVSDGGLVDSSALFGGTAGTVDLEATESITVAGRNQHGDRAQVSSATGGLGAAGTLSLRAPTIRLDDHGTVATGSVPFAPSPDGGPAGRVVVEAGRLFVTGGGQIDSSSLTQGAAGDVTIRAADSITISGAGSRIATRAGGAGAGGDISLMAPQITIANGGEISSESAPGLGQVAVEFLVAEGLVTPPAEATGEGGSIRIETDHLSLQQGSIGSRSTGGANAGSIAIVDARTVALTDSAITTEATQGSGGNITLETSDLLHLVRSAITASVSSGSGGNVTIGNPQLILLEEGSRIVAQAVEGSGGNIVLGADVLIASPDSLISASSELGVQGTLEIRAPDTDLASELAPLPSTFLDAVGLMKKRCAERQGGERAGSFVWTGRSGAPGSPDGPLPVYYDAPEPRRVVELAGLLVGASTEGEPAALLVGCGAS